MTSVTYICQEPKIFSLQEAQTLVTLLQRITHKHETRVNKLIQSQQFLVKSNAPDRVLQSYQEEVNRELSQWAVKIRKLGCVPLPGCAVGIDAGGFYWSWFFNDTKIEHYHLYTEIPGNRRHLSLRVPQSTLVIT